MSHALDRKTGRLGNHFLPRFAVPERAQQAAQAAKDQQP
jgi:hypothetical protein